VCLLVCFLFSYRDPPKKVKKIHIFRYPITLRAANFVLVTLLSLCPSCLSLVAGLIRVLSLSILLRALFVPLTDSTFPT
jgi:predicted membrane protein